MNNCTFTGNLGRDADVRYTPSGAAVASFSIAIKSGYGEREKTSWVRCALFGKRAEGKLIDYLKKGQMIVVSGEISLNEYQAHDGTTKTSLEMSVNQLDLIGGKDAAPQQAQKARQPQKARQKAPQQAQQSQSNDFDDTDIPF